MAASLYRPLYLRRLSTSATPRNLYIGTCLLPIFDNNVLLHTSGHMSRTYWLGLAFDFEKVILPVVVKLADLLSCFVIMCIREIAFSLSFGKLLSLVIGRIKAFMLNWRSHAICLSYLQFGGLIVHTNLVLESANQTKLPAPSRRNLWTLRPLQRKMSF